MANPRIKVLGYAQAVQYVDGIQYRNFTPDLAGLQLTSSGGTALFTMGNFAVSTNLDPKVDKNFITNNFSNFITLSDLNTTLEATLTLLTNNAGVNLNLDKNDLTNYALFGSLSEFIRVSLEDIITNWPAALYVNPQYSLPPVYITQSGYTVENYTYDSFQNQASFMVNVNTLNNKFQINFLQNGTLNNTFNSNNTIRNMIVNYQSYSILYNGSEFDVLQFTGSSNSINDYVYFVVDGNVFSGANTNDYLIYYIKPNTIQENTFYNSLPNFEAYLLNRQVQPKFTASFRYSVKSDAGNILYITDSVTWPTSDGYNIDFDTVKYTDYATKLLNISTDFDLTTSNLMTRFLVTDSITDFDTTDVHLDPLDQDSTDQKMNKTLVIYGREFDEINNFIKGIQFVNTVTYDKNNNTPDIYLKNVANILGWELISSVLENDLLKNYIIPGNSTYSGYSVGLTPVEADTELWRRIILNTPWIWKSKGTRKAVEFLFKFIGTPTGLISFNEYIYLAENVINMDIFQSALQLNNADLTLTDYPLTFDGYPNPLPNTSSLYFQNNGLWYRETGGASSMMDITTGNNPHVGPYDGGYDYINQFRSLIPNFVPVTISSQTITTDSINLFNNYNGGTITDYEGNTYVDITADDGGDFSNCVLVTSSIIEDPQHRQDQTNCGCIIPTESKALSICVNNAFPSFSCQETIANVNLVQPQNYYTFDYYQYNIDNSLYMVNGNPVYYSSQFVDRTCCNALAGIPYLWNQLDASGNLINTGYICCQATNTCGCITTCSWTLDSTLFILNPQDNQKYLVFDTETGQTRTTSQDGCNCIANYTSPVQIVDPITQETGYGCQLTSLGLADIISPSSVIQQTYQARSTGTIGCSDVACVLSLTTSNTNSNNGGANGSATVSPSGGVGPYTYLWNNGQITSTAVSLTAGTYSVIVNDSTNCSATATVIINSTLCSLTLTTSSTPSIGNTGTATATPIGGTGVITYLWKFGNTIIPQTTRIITGLAVGTYSVTATDAVGCSQTQSVIVSPITCSLTVNIFATNVSATANVNGENGAVTYLWSNGETTQTIGGLVSGTYTVTVTDSIGCQATATSSLSTTKSIPIQLNETTAQDVMGVKIWVSTDLGVTWTPFIIAASNLSTVYKLIGNINGVAYGSTVYIGVSDLNNHMVSFNIQGDSNPYCGYGISNFYYSFVVNTKNPPLNITVVSSSTGIPNTCI